MKKGSQNLLNELGIEVIEISDSQETPKEMALLSLSQADLTWLDTLFKQSDYEGGMQSDIMGQSSL